MRPVEYSKAGYRNGYGNPRKLTLMSGTIEGRLQPGQMGKPRTRPTDAWWLVLFAERGQLGGLMPGAGPAGTFGNYQSVTYLGAVEEVLRKHCDVLDVVGSVQRPGIGAKPHACLHQH